MELGLCSEGCWGKGRRAKVVWWVICNIEVGLFSSDDRPPALEKFRAVSMAGYFAHFAHFVHLATNSWNFCQTGETYERVLSLVQKSRWGGGPPILDRPSSRAATVLVVTVIDCLARAMAGSRP
jgi:hypothetical protein